jgi:hypothetical protein
MKAIYTLKVRLAGSDELFGSVLAVPDSSGLTFSIPSDGSDD